MIQTAGQWVRLLAGFVLVFALFQWLAQALGSDRGQSGLVVGTVVVVATVIIERAIFKPQISEAVRTLGLTSPAVRGMAAVGAVSLALLLVVPFYAGLSGAILTFRSGWVWLLPGLFAQAGVAEEILFRGYLFGHVRRGRSFWTAAWLSMIPFVAGHLLLFLTMPWPIALAALILSVVMSVPLAHLFELGGGSIWPPALLHFVVQATVKIVTFDDGSSSTFPIVWMMTSAVLPLLVFLVPRRSGPA
jgi:membrane protease YdiL (CAAX protease family)